MLVKLSHLMQDRTILPLNETILQAPHQKSISLAFYKTILNSNVKNKVYLCT